MMTVAVIPIILLSSLLLFFLCICIMIFIQPGYGLTQSFLGKIKLLRSLLFIRCDLKTEWLRPYKCREYSLCLLRWFLLCVIFFTLGINLHNILLYHVTDTLVTALKRPRLVEFQSQQFRSVYHIYHPVSLLYCERIYLYDLLGCLVLKIQICYTLRCTVT